MFFPRTLLPLHVFEPRYQTLASEALRENQPICVALLKPGWEEDYYGTPEVYPVGCVGKIVQHQKLADGRYNLTLHGETKVRIVECVRDDPYRVVRVRPIQDDSSWAEGSGAPQEIVDLIRLFRQVHQGDAAGLALSEMFGQHMSPESVLNTVAMHLDVEPDIKERLLEVDSLDVRYRTVLHILKNATTTQERIERVRHLFPRDRRIN